MDDLRSRTSALLERLTDDQVVLVQDYARYLRDKRSWDDAATILSSREEAADVQGHALEKLLSEGRLASREALPRARAVPAPGSGHAAGPDRVLPMPERGSRVGPARSSR